jgi:hypothetical protein
MILFHIQTVFYQISTESEEEGNETQRRRRGELNAKTPLRLRSGGAETQRRELSRGEFNAKAQRCRDAEERIKQRGI